MTPTLLKIFSMSIDTSLEIPLQNLVSTLVFVLLPVGVGLLIKSKSSELAVKVEKIGSILGSITILIMIVIWFPKVFELVKAQSGNTFAAIGLMSFIGILIGFVISKLSGASAANAKALAFETGIQNAPLAFAIITLSLSKDVLLEISWIPLLYGALSVGNAIIFMGIFKGFVKTKKAAIT
jgi:BASS family bile acid:Na+ symporter